MKKWMFAVMMVLLMMLVACNGESDVPTEEEQVEEEQIIEEEQAEEQIIEEEITEEMEEEETTEEIIEEEMIDVGGEYPVSAEYTEYQFMDFYFEDQDETVSMVVARNADATKYDVQFTFFNDAQELIFTVEEDQLNVTFDKTGFIAKKVEKIWTTIQENNDWMTLALDQSSDSSTEEMIDVGEEYPISAKYTEYQLVEYYIEELDENARMIVARNNDATEYDVQFTLFNDAQELTFTIEDEEPNVIFDKSGFIEKDVDYIWAAIQESDDWKIIE